MMLLSKGDDVAGRPLAEQHPSVPVNGISFSYPILQVGVELTRSARP